MKKVILITGASSGIGKATAEMLRDEGHIVYGAARDIEAFKSMNGIQPLKVDMADYQSLDKALKKIIKEQGRIDVLFNNAGFGQYGSVEETPLDDARYQFEVNLFGLARLTQLVLPHMRTQKSGLIINTSSMGGKMYTPLGAWYHATKHALEGWSDSLRLEVKAFGINVVIIEPGTIQTKWGKKAIDRMMHISGAGPYKKFAEAVAKRMTGTYGNQHKLSPPSVIATVVSKAINTQKPKTRYVAGKYAKSLIFARKYLGDRIFDTLISP